MFKIWLPLTGSLDAINMAESFVISSGPFKLFGLLELFSVVLFIIPHTGILGTLLLVTFMGCAIATHLELNFLAVGSIGIAAFLWIVAALRFPELVQRIRAGRI